VLFISVFETFTCLTCTGVLIVSCDLQLSDALGGLWAYCSCIHYLFVRLFIICRLFNDAAISSECSHVFSV